MDTTAVKAQEAWRKKGKWAFPVELRPIQDTTGLIIPKRQVVVRTDTNTPIEVVSDDYDLFPHAKAMDLAEAAFKTVGTHEKSRVNLTNNGANLFAEYIFPTVAQKILGKVMYFKVTLVNSYNKTAEFGLILGAYRLTCQNGMVSGEKMLSFTQKHSGRKLDKISKEDILPAFKKYEELMPRYEAMTDRKVKVQHVLEDIIRKQRFPKEVVADMINTEKLGVVDGRKPWEKMVSEMSEWELYNAFTHYMSHNFGSHRPNQEISHGRKMELEIKIGKYFGV